MTVRVREATGADVDAVVEVAEDAWYAAYGGFLDLESIERGLQENYDPQLVAAAIDHDEIAFYVADVAEDEATPADLDAVVGFASAERTWADEVELHTVYVHPDRWGEGVGTALLERIEDWARREGVERIAGSVLADNLVGVGFLEAVGFTRGVEAAGEVGGELHAEYEYEYEL